MNAISSGSCLAKCEKVKVTLRTKWSFGGIGAVCRLSMVAVVVVIEDCCFVLVALSDWFVVRWLVLSGYWLLVVCCGWFVRYGVWPVTCGYGYVGMHDKLMKTKSGVASSRGAVSLWESGFLPSISVRYETSPDPPSEYRTRHMTAPPPRYPTALWWGGLTRSL